MPGGYYKKYHQKRGYDQVISLTLHKDSVFILSDKWFEINSTCTGKWFVVSKDTIVLRCFDEKFPAQISSGYLNEREKKIIVLGKNKLKLDNSFLKRSKK